MTYTPEVDWSPGTMVTDLDPEAWAQLDRTEKPVSTVSMMTLTVTIMSHM